MNSDFVFGDLAEVRASRRSLTIFHPTVRKQWEQKRVGTWKAGLYVVQSSLFWMVA
ncbi:hypothetical protein LCM20_15030 [Halobacillus litoralis]|uniref:hypothetical protein n=1 Tax=Halobacillus litoralis TaxID=45668 RepID=UPI001CD1DF86|nr:hypothetical protein [Halobacillus litoralis]MCA0971918.1 hypothetical protein [Halobacillus litoralis]